MREYPALHGAELRSRVGADDTVTLSLVEVEHAPPGDGEVIVRMEAAPVNPSDLLVLLGPADAAAAKRHGPDLIAPIPPGRAAAVAARIGQPMRVGNEGAGTVVAAGAGAEALIGRPVALAGGGTYAQYRRTAAGDVMPLADGLAPRDGASATINPMTALAMIETMRDEGHHAIVNTAAASNLGRMLNRACVADGIPLVSVVRSAVQRALLLDEGAAHVVDSSRDDFATALAAAVAATGATLAFDAVGGGRLASDLLVAMETALSAGKPFSRYGSDVHKQVYVYGRLDPAPISVTGSYGMAWGIGGFLLTPRLARFGAERVAAMRARVMAELTTTFASGYSHVIGLADLLDPAVLQAMTTRATGDKFLVDPSRQGDGR